jgi:hypothetical protein
MVESSKLVLFFFGFMFSKLIPTIKGKHGKGQYLRYVVDDVGGCEVNPMLKVWVGAK